MRQRKYSVENFDKAVPTTLRVLTAGKFVFAK